MFANCLTPPLKKRGYLTKNVRACIFALENRSYLGEFEAEFKKALACESGAQGVLCDVKTMGQKSHDTVPLRYCIFFNCFGITKKYNMQKKKNFSSKML
jgi:hypothetical protein